MTVSVDLKQINSWLMSQGVTENEINLPAAAEDIDALRDIFLGEKFDELAEFYGLQDGLPHWFILYGTWEFMPLKQSLRQLEEQANDFNNSPENYRWSKNWLPILTNNGGDFVFIDLFDGSVKSFSHITGETRQEAVSFREFLRLINSDVQNGDYVFVDDEPVYQGQREIGFS